MVGDLYRQYPDRVYFPPIAELGYVGAGIGAAIAGLRPIVDCATASFTFQAFAQILNEAANIHYMSGGQTSVPMVIHYNHGVRGGGAAQHSHSPQAMMWNTPGLEIVTPSNPADLIGLVLTAVASDNPTIWVDHVRLFDIEGEVPENIEPIPFGRASIPREGTDLTIFASSWMVRRSLEASELLASEGISVEVVDPRTLVPLDEEAILRSVAKTGRLLVVDECHLRCGVGAEIAATVAEHAYGDLLAPIRRLATLDVPVPFSPPLEQYVEPTTAKILAAARSVTGVQSGA
jgi:pyruvate dehydrogenase E1 component beta subunit